MYSKGRHIATVYGYNLLSSNDLPSVHLTGLIWKQADDPSLFAELYDRLMERAEVDRWYDACILCVGLFLFTFGYAFTRYSDKVNGGYPYTMVPFYTADKALCWAGLWMFLVPPFAGNILALSASFKNWSTLSVIDKMLFLISSPIAAFTSMVFVLPWLTWYILRGAFFCKLDLGTAGPKNVIKRNLVDMVSLKRETGVIGFFLSFAHGFAGAIIANPAYKKKWFTDNGHFYGNNELSLACGVVALSLLTAVMLRSLFGKDSWVKLKPMYSYAAPLGLWIATFHVVLMGYKGWYQLFDYNTKKGQPSITFVSTVFPICVLAVNHMLTVFGTKKRVASQHIWRHSVTNAAYVKYTEIHNEFLNGVLQKTANDDSLDSC